MRIGLYILGCDKNTVDAEYLAGLLEDSGCEVLAEPSHETEQDAAVVVTCGFIADAKEQSLTQIMQLAANKEREGNPRRLFIMGCLAQRYAEDLKTALPQIDGIVGVGQLMQLRDMILKRRKTAFCVREVPRVSIRTPLPRKRLNAQPHSFLKIADGCNHKCTFCSIPLMKGGYVSVSPDILLAEAERLLKDGIKELNLVAQDISLYGIDRWKHYRLPDLLNELASLPGDFWIRCLYCYPNTLDSRLLATIAEQPKIVPYLDVPFQHFDPDVLDRMGRPFGHQDPNRIVSHIRTAVPNIALRTTVLVGFPGETRRAHQNLLAAIRRLRLERLGAFIYSAEEGTEAANFPDQVPMATRRRRWNRVMQVQAEIAAACSAARVGSRIRVLVEDYDERTGYYVARSAWEAPEIDGQVYVKSKKKLKQGFFCDVEVIAADVYDIYAKPLQKQKRIARKD